MSEEAKITGTQVDIDLEGDKAKVKIRKWWMLPVICVTTLAFLFGVVLILYWANQKEVIVSIKGNPKSKQSELKKK